VTAEPPANDRETARSLGNAATMFAVTPASARLAGQRTTDLGATADPASQDPGSAPLPTRLGRYHVLERLGSGGMGVVFAAYDPDLDRKVAVKLLRVDRPGSDSQLRLLREAQALARLSHPNVVQVHDAGTLGDQVFVAMEFVRGHDLRAWLTGPPRPQADILRMFVAAGHGLAAAHDAGLVHRDFKPENVLVGADGRARVADFGLARHGPDVAPDAHSNADDADARPPQTALDVSLTATGAVLGTPAYMSPEQHLGQPADARSDQFAFCVALWEALYDQRPFVGDTYVELRTSVLAGTLVPPPAGTRVPRRLGELLRRGLATEPGQRHASMHALLEALVRDPARARRRWLAGAVLSTMALGTAFAFADWRASAANVCSGGADELASTWNDERRAALSSPSRPPRTPTWPPSRQRASIATPPNGSPRTATRASTITAASRPTRCSTPGCAAWAAAAAPSPAPSPCSRAPPRPLPTPPRSSPSSRGSPPATTATPCSPTPRCPRIPPPPAPSATSTSACSPPAPATTPATSTAPAERPAR